MFGPSDGITSKIWIWRMKWVTLMGTYLLAYQEYELQLEVESHWDAGCCRPQCEGWLARVNWRDPSRRPERWYIIGNEGTKCKGTLYCMCKDLGSIESLTDLASHTAWATPSGAVMSHDLSWLLASDDPMCLESWDRFSNHYFTLCIRWNEYYIKCLTYQVSQRKTNRKWGYKWFEEVTKSGKTRQKRAIKTHHTVQLWRRRPQSKGTKGQ